MCDKHRKYYWATYITRETQIQDSEAIHNGASNVAQQVKPLCATLALNWVPVQGSADPFAIKDLANVPWKVTEGGSSPWAPINYMGDAEETSCS